MKVHILSARHLTDYKIEVTFSDGKVNVFDYTNLVMRDHAECVPYREEEAFKQFKVVNNNEIAWGDNWDMLLPFKTIYTKSGLTTKGRKKVKDKKVPLRIYINQSIIDAHGGESVVQEKLISYLTTNK
jgi:hypothetical protein